YNVKEIEQRILLIAIQEKIQEDDFFFSASKAIQEKNTVFRYKSFQYNTKDIHKSKKAWKFKGRVIVPYHKIEEILKLVHLNQPSTKHQGIARTQKWIAKRYFWVGLSKTIQEFINNCDTCIKTKRYTNVKWQKHALDRATIPGN